MENRVNNIGKKGSDTKGYIFCDKLIEYLLTGLLIFMPLAFGVVHQFSVFCVVIISACMMGLFLLRQILFADEGPVSPLVYVPIVVFILLGLFSLVPLPKETASMLSRQTVELKTQMVSEEAQVADENVTLSFYPQATKDNLKIIISVAAIFVVVLNVFKKSEQIERLLKTIVVIGSAVGLLAIAQNLAGNGKIYWFVNSPQPAISGPFVNHSHFGQFMNLSIGAAIGLVLITLFRRFERDSLTAVSVFEYIESSQSRKLWLLVGMISVSVAALFASLTRGGMASMLFAMSITVLLLSGRRPFRKHGWIVIVVGLAALVCLLYTGFDTVYERFATLSSLDKYGTRLEILKDMTEPIRKFFVFGTGLGTHEVIYPMFQSVNTALRFSHAENEYAQLIEEAGITAFLTMLCFGAFVVLNFVRAIRNKKSVICLAGYGLGFGLIAVLVHSVSDFGQHLAANASLSAIFCALIINLGRKKTDNPSLISRFGKISTVIFSVFIAAAYCWIIVGSYKAAVAEHYWSKACGIERKISVGGRVGSDSEFAELIAIADKTIKIQPENIEYRYWKNVWRWWQLSQKTDADIGGLTDGSIDQIYEIVGDLKEATKICPTFGPTYCLMGQLQKFVLLEPAGEDNIKKGFVLQPKNEMSLFAVGCLDISEGKNVEAFEKFMDSVALADTYFWDVVKIYINQTDRADLAIELADGDSEKMLYVAQVLSKDEKFSEETKQAKLRCVKIIENKITENTVTIEDLIFAGDYYSLLKNNIVAAEYYQMAVAGDYGDAELRVKFAQALAETNKPIEAMKQLRIALKLRPGFDRAKELLAKLAVRDDVIKQSINE